MDKALIDSAAKSLDVEAVWLRGSTIRCKEDFMPQFIEADLSLTPQLRVVANGTFHVVTATHNDTGDVSRTALFYFTAAVRLTDISSAPEDETGEDVASEDLYLEIEAEFCAQYNVHDDVDEEAIRPAFEEFGRYNVGYHVWPYWREYVQGTCARLGIPPIPVPMYRIPRAAPEEASEPEAE